MIKDDTKSFCQLMGNNCTSLKQNLQNCHLDSWFWGSHLQADRAGMEWKRWSDHLHSSKHCCRSRRMKRSNITFRLWIQVILRQTNLQIHSSWKKKTLTLYISKFLQMKSGNSQQNFSNMQDQACLFVCCWCCCLFPGSIVEYSLSFARARLIDRT